MKSYDNLPLERKLDSEGVIHYEPHGMQAVESLCGMCEDPKDPLKPTSRKVTCNGCLGIVEIVLTAAAKQK